jgi:CDGSH-type Zn-finger protein
MTSLPKIEKKGSYKVDVEEGKSYFWCSCGLSAQQPFCDGSHKGTGLKSVCFTATTTETVSFCGCKASKNFPFCDGSHKNLADPSN